MILDKKKIKNVFFILNCTNWQNKVTEDLNKQKATIYLLLLCGMSIKQHNKEF